MGNYCLKSWTFLPLQSLCMDFLLFFWSNCTRMIFTIVMGMIKMQPYRLKKIAWTGEAAGYKGKWTCQISSNRSCTYFYLPQQKVGRPKLSNLQVLRVKATNLSMEKTFGLNTFSQYFSFLETWSCLMSL